MKTIDQIELNMLIENHNTYLKTITDTNKKGKRLVLDAVDFTNNDLSSLNFVDIYITSSVFNSQVFENINLGDAKLYSCGFKDVVFKNCDFGKTTLDYTRIIDSKFFNCNLIDLETVESDFEGLFFNKCSFDGAFSNCMIKSTVFEECTFVSTEFWRCAIKNLKVCDKNGEWDLKRIIREVNIGTVENPLFVKGSQAIKYFESECVVF